jgi:signal transduction histidine kinase
MILRGVTDSLFGRLVLTFVGGLLLAMAIVFLLQEPEREAFVFRISTSGSAYRIADVVKLMNQLPGADRPRLADIVTARGMRTTLGVPAPGPGGEEPGSFAGIFRALLSESLGKEQPAVVDVIAAQLPRSERPAGEPLEGYALQVTTRLEDGSWIRFDFAEPRRLPRWPRRVLMYMGISMLVMAALSFVAVRWVTRPLHRLASAAEALGRDINQPPLTERGPQEVRRAARAFNAMQERLSRYIRTRTGILAAMSHDLKTPITRLRLRAELLEHTETREKFVRDLADMERLVGTTLEYMRGLDDREPLQPIDIPALLAALQADAEETGHSVRLLGHADAPFYGKPLGLRRCLQNLLDNAVRYAQDTEIEVRDQPQCLTLYVRDRGPGIPEAELDGVFEPFYRLEASRNPATGGSGLGLSIARNLAQSMGGDVSLRNRPGGGLEVTVTLPRAPDSGGRSTAAG